MQKSDSNLLGHAVFLSLFACRQTSLPKLVTRAFGKIRRWSQEFCVEVVIFVLGLIVANLIFIADVFRETNTVNPVAAGQLGDFVGGYVGTIFALISVVLLFSTLKYQRLASQLNNFETKFFELIKMHRDNVAELELQNTSGRRIFVLLIRELRSILDIVKEIAGQHKQQLTQQQLLHIAYYCLFFGTGPNSSRMLTMSLKKFNTAFIHELVNELDNTKTKNRVQKVRKFGYVPFEGHQSRLGHYYRHLYQTICYVHKQELSIDKYEYIKTLRAQLTTHEQALLLVNSLTPMGQDWWKKEEELIVVYKMVKNIPRDFFDKSTELDIDSLFASGYFEWQEVDTAT